MAWQLDPVPDTFRANWRSGDHVGEAKPTQVVEIRRITHKRGYGAWTGDDVRAIIPEETRGRPWRAHFTVVDDWTDLPNVASVELTQDFAQNGMTVATIVLENIGYPEKTGVGGLYHAIERGFLSPYRGYNAPGRPAKQRDADGAKIARNEWYGVLARMSQIRVWQGYGEPERDEDGVMPDDGGTNGAWAFVGMIDDIDPESHPDRITVTVRDHGRMLTDLRIFGFNKSPSVLDPIQFMDRLDADDTKLVGGAARASSSGGGHPPRLVCDESSATYWRSASHSAAGVTEWVEIRIPAGRYEEIVLQPAYAGLECYIGVYAKDRLGPHNTVHEGNVTEGVSYQPPLLDGHEIPEGWVDLGLGDVPGTNGGWTYMRHIGRLSGKQHTHRLLHSLVVGDNTIVRVGFRNLSEAVPGSFRAGVRRLQARWRKRRKEVIKSKVILVDDVSDIVKCCLRWAGFDEWAVETTGLRAKGKWTFNRSNFLIDPILKAAEQTGYVFSIGDPTSGESHGLPIFRRNQALKDAPQDLEEIRDTDLLTGIKVKITEEPLAWDIRVRGKETKDKKFSNHLGGDWTRRVMAYYEPPWTRAGRMAGVLKHVTWTYPDLKTYQEVLYAAYLIAVGQALQAATAVVQIPAHPGFNLDDQVGLLDIGTGMNTRMWISNRTSTFVTGEKASWVMTLGGSLMDTPDMVALRRDIDSDADDERWIGRPGDHRYRKMVVD